MKEITDLTQLATEAQRTCQAWEDAAREYNLAVRHRELLGPIGRYAGAEYRARIALSEARAACRAHLAASRGWIVAKSDFTSSELIDGKRPYYGYGRGELNSGVIDHPDCFRHPTRPYRPAAIVSHTYYPVEQCRAFASEHGLVMEVLPGSWYSSRTDAVLFVRAD